MISVQGASRVLTNTILFVNYAYDHVLQYLMARFNVVYKFVFSVNIVYSTLIQWLCSLTNMVEIILNSLSMQEGCIHWARRWWICKCHYSKSLTCKHVENLLYCVYHHYILIMYNIVISLLCTSTIRFTTCLTYDHLYIWPYVWQQGWQTDAYHCMTVDRYSRQCAISGELSHHSGSITGITVMLI